MPALNFKEQFVPKILAGVKTSTIRKRRKDKRDPVPGSALYLYTGLRTKKALFLKLEHCSCVTPIEILENGVVLDLESGFPIIGKALLKMAMREGFKSSIELTEFFQKEYGLPFEGLWIKW